jgi:serine protease AprX
MPNKNKQIKSVKINGKKVSAKKIQLNDSIVLSEKEQMELGAGQAVNVEIKFKAIETVSAADYQVSFGENVQTESDAEHPSNTPTNAPSTYSTANSDEADGEKVAGKVVFHAETNEVSWQVSNRADYMRELELLNLSFPSENAAIQSVKINQSLVSFVLNDENKVVFNQPFEITNLEAIEIRVAFEILSSAFNDEYELSVQFTDGVTAKVIVPDNSGEKGAERDTNYPTLVKANLAHQQGYTGYGVTVAILDTGIRDLPEILLTTQGVRNITIVDVLDTSDNAGQAKRNDFNGHGTHLASIITNSSPAVDVNGNSTGSYNGIAPDANLVVLKAFDEEGQSSYTAILAALDYVVENKDVLDIKVLNLSFSAIPSSYYWDDPLNQALMRAWDAGITVIAAAGNRGPEAMTIGVPGNTPYVITVGAVSDNYTPSNLNDDFVTTFSSAGPTFEGFVKPELVAPGGHIAGVMDKDTLIRETYAIYNDKDKDAHNYFELSGSSQSTAVTSGIVALMLQANPNLSPDDIKCRLIETAKTATTETGALAFSVFQQGAGLVDAMAAIESTAMGCSNAGLSIEKDLSGEEHFIGPARRHENEGDYYIPGIEGLEWSGVYSDSQLWRNTSFNADSQLWRNTSFNADSQLWRHTSFNSNSQLWRNTSFSADSQLWRNTSFNADSQLWRNTSFNTESQLWRKTSFNTDSIIREWVNHE